MIVNDNKVVSEWAFLQIPKVRFLWLPATPQCSLGNNIFQKEFPKTTNLLPILCILAQPWSYFHPPQILHCQAKRHLDRLRLIYVMIQDIFKESSGCETSTDRAETKVIARVHTMPHRGDNHHLLIEDWSFRCKQTYYHLSPYSIKYHCGAQRFHREPFINHKHQPMLNLPGFVLDANCSRTIITYKSYMNGVSQSCSSIWELLS